MTPRRHRRSAALAGAVLLALLGHVVLMERLHESLQVVDLKTASIQRAEVRFDRQLAPTAPVAVQAAPPRVAPAARRGRASAPEPAEVADVADEPEVPDEPDEPDEPDAPEPPASSPEVPEGSEIVAEPAVPAASDAVPAVAAASAPEPDLASAAASTPAFEWPASTRLSYRLTGWYRGEVHGQAEVQWLRLDAMRYQVHLSVSIGPAIAPLMTRRMSSEGRITPAGLAPQRYEQLTTQIVGRDRQASMAFEPEGIRLARGDRVPYRVDVQDTASQFIQIIWLLRTQPDLARKGQAMAFALALPNRVDDWVYEVAETAIEPTPVGPLETLHVKPRRRAEGGNLTAQMWYAPALQMLPVRIRIEQDADTWVDLRLEKAPEQGG